MEGKQLSRRGRLSRRRGVATDELRRHNLSAVLDRLHLKGPATRSELSEEVGLNRSTIRDLIGELAELGLLEEQPGEASRGPGRPSPVAVLRPVRAVVIAIELAVDSIAVATIGLGGHVFDVLRSTRIKGRSSPGETLGEVTGLTSALLASLPRDYLLAGVGVAVPGLVRRSDGLVDLAPNLGWHKVPLGDMMADHLGISRVMLANEADLGALAEYRRGGVSPDKHLIYVAGEVGIGAGIIQDGVPMRGSAGYAGEAGHMVINPQGRECRCGSVGCWETEAGEEAIARKADIAETIRGQELIETVVSRAEARDPKTVMALTEVGRWLGLGIGNLINLFNPDMILVGGLYDALYPFFEEAIETGVTESALDAPSGMATIGRGALGRNATLVGASEMVLSSVIADPAGYEGLRARPIPETGLGA